ncbi:MAG TPA: nicotinate-nucleotide adenylyltransferase [Actinomycetota bacterium]|nr:nicotinate-nucleotide adenylyltransferase [Actinomycetota bacterium]
MTIDDARVARLGVMGGTFDPIHIGHLVAASEALYAFELDRVTFVPTGQPWQKRFYSDAEDRYLMTVLGAASNPCFAVSRVELDRKGPTYTADTMDVLRSFHGDGVELFFIVGGDAVLRLGTWHKVERLAALATVIAVTRPGFALGNLVREPSWPELRVLEMPGIDVSSTDVRARVRAGRPIDYVVPADVVRYIRDRGLYTAGDPDG